jgi:hypothetical protein
MTKLSCSLCEVRHDVGMNVPVRALVLLGLFAASCTGPTVATPSTSATVAATNPASTGAASDRVAADVANRVLADRIRETGRGFMAICLYVDPSTGLNEDVALVALKSAIDGLVQQGYSRLNVVLCKEAPYFLRTNTVHPKNSGGAVGPPVRVSVPSPYLLFFAVTTPTRINTIFGGLTTRRGDEEFICSGDNCASVTGSIYADPTAFADAATRQSLVLEGLGLLVGK